MNALHVGRTLIAASTLVFGLAPVASVANAQTAPASTTCVIAQRPLTADEESMVNDYEVQVAKANSKHTAIPVMSDPVFLLIGCDSPADQTGPDRAVASSSSTAATSATAAPTTGAASPSTSTGPAVTPGFTCPSDGLTKDQQSMINDFEILVARANSKHTDVPMPSQDVANLLS
jgi:hypothetical protein